MSRILLVLFVLCVPIPVAAQGTPATPAAVQSIEEVRRTARAHLGPTYITPAVQLKELGVDSNVFNQAGDQKSDFMFNVSPKVDVWVPMARRALFTTTGAVDLVWYSKYRTERSVNPQVAARGEVYLHRLTIFAEDAFLRTRERLNYELDLRAEHRENNLSAGARYRITPRFSVEVAGRRGLTEFDADAFFLGSSLQQTLNRSTTGVAVTARHRFSPLTTAAFRVERFGDRFPFDSDRDTDSLRIMPGIEVKPRGLVSGSAYLGYRRFQPKHPQALQDFSGFVANLSLSYTFLGSSTLGVSYSRDVNYSIERLQPYFIASGYGASVRRALGRRLDVLVSADRYTYAYRDLAVVLPSVPGQVTSQRVDTTWNYAGSIGHRIARGGRIGLGASYWTRESSTASFRNYNGLRIGPTVTYGF
ncbi:MAG: outer membrane beta-barrel protein [Acidobacteriota bacterium]